LSAEVAVIAADAVSFGVVFTEPCIRVTASIEFADSSSRAGNRCPCAYPGLAGVVDGADAGVVARRSIREVCVGAFAGGGVASQFGQAGVGSVARLFRATNARPGLATVVECTSVVVTAEGSVCGVIVGANSQVAVASKRCFAEDFFAESRN
jgi:hypothetical protein